MPRRLLSLLTALPPAAGAAVSGFEAAATNGRPETFKVTSYGLRTPR